MPCPNGTAVVMKFDNVDNTASYICQLAHELSAHLFHLIFWHAQADVQCDCKTSSENPNICALGMLLHEEILTLVSEYTAEVTRQHRRKKYYTSYKKKVRESEMVQQTTNRKVCDKIQKQRKRANETMEETTARLSDNKCRKTREANETLEKTAQRRLSNNKYRQTRKANETMEETTKRRLSDNKYRQKRKSSETMEQTAKRRLSDNKYRQKRKASETMEETAKRRLSDNKYRQTRKANETVEETAKRKLSDSKYRRKRKANETIEETAERRLSDKKHKQTRRANETLEQLQHRKKADKDHRYKTRLSKKLKVPTIEDAMNNFKSECQKQPVYICTACHRLLWKKGVQHFNMNNYNSVDSEVINFVLSEKYRKSSADGLIYICLSCNKKLRSGTIPAQNKANCMDLEEIPDELKDLNNLELHTISKRILFMKLVKLPRGKQKGIKGAAVNVPTDLGPACTLLPRIPTEAHIISLKLKRKLEYRQAYLHDTIRPEKVISALHYLKRNNPLYTDIEINEDWIQTWKEMDQELYDGIFNIDEDHENNEETTEASHNNAKADSDCSSTDPNDNEGKHDHNNEEDNEDMIAMEQNCKLRDLPIDTCLQCEVPEQANQIFSIAPGEGSKPIPLLTDKLFEEWQGRLCRYRKAHQTHIAEIC